MGCVSSKLVSRSLSFHEELNQSLQRRKANGSGQFLALVSSANSVPDEILFTSFASESNKCLKPTVELDTCELKASVEQEEKKQVQPASPVVPKVTESIEVDLARRSKSFHWFDDYEVSSLAPESFDGIKEYRSMRANGGRTRARSFHTVEEFDAMVEKISLSRTGQTGFGGKEDSSLQLHHSKSSSDLSEHAAHKLHQEVKQSRAEESRVIEDKSALFGSRTEPDKARTAEEITQKGNIPLKGLKRKAVANKLESLGIPPGIDFPGVADLREWINAGGQVYSPGSYVTPKFGSYSLPKSGLANKCSEGTVFDPELVAAFEECMEQHGVEEESILKQIEENFEEENTQKKINEERLPSHRNNISCQKKII